MVIITTYVADDNFRPHAMEWIELAISNSSTVRFDRRSTSGENGDFDMIATPSVTDTE